ncbi:hypothetical protein BGZ83_005899 [Gryganskiella cystojenkinii]|nr:hypothetical protein BGZ83_005899 [Gryganskiella cystojenkinii]
MAQQIYKSIATSTWGTCNHSSWTPFTAQIRSQTARLQQPRTLHTSTILRASPRKDDPFKKLDEPRSSSSSSFRRSNNSSTRSSDNGPYSKDRGDRGNRSSSLSSSSSSDRDRFLSRPSSSYRSNDGAERGNRRESSFGGSNFSRNERSFDPEMYYNSKGDPSRIMRDDRDYLYSPNVVLPALKQDLRTPYKLYYSHTQIQNRKKMKQDPIADCIAAANERGIPVVKTTKHDLNTLSGQRPHQGVILEASKLEQHHITGLGEVATPEGEDRQEYVLQGSKASPRFISPSNEHPVWVACDEVVDPQNLGSILRSSMFLGVDGVVVCHKNSTPLSAVVAKASVGALETRPTYGVKSLMKFIQNSQKNGWHVVGAHVTYGSKRNQPIHRWPETGVSQPTILIMGSEGDGLRKQIVNQCDSFIQIPNLSKITSNVDSLNVGVATGIILTKLMGGRFLQLPENLKKYPLRGREGEDLLTTGGTVDTTSGQEDEEEEDEVVVSRNGNEVDEQDDKDEVVEDKSEVVEEKTKTSTMPF